MMTRDNRAAFLKRRRQLLVLAFVVLAAALYTAGVPRHPPGFYIDESSVSYNAYTISETGRDEHGQIFPLYFRAFGDYKNPIHVYLLAGLFKLTGPSIRAARLLSAVAGLAAAFLLGVLGARIATGRRAVGFLTAGFALLTPWLFETSRVVMEVTLYPLALALFLLCLYRAALKQKLSPGDAAALALTLALLTYTYSIGRLLGPLLALGLLFFMTRERWMGVLATWLAYLLTLVPLFVFNARNPGALAARFNAVTYLTPEQTYLQTAARFVKHFVGNLNPWRLVFAGDPNPNQPAHVHNTGHLLFAAVVLAAFGLWLVLRRHRRDAFWRFVLYGLVVSIVPASLTKDYVHMLRLVALPVFVLVLIVPALAWFVERIRTSKFAAKVFVLLLLLGAAQAIHFQWRFYQSTNSTARLHLFDANYTRDILAPALASSSNIIYLADAVSIPGYIQAYWHATIQGVKLSRFVRLGRDEPAPAGALVITTEENCQRCSVIARTPPYTLYATDAAPNPPSSPP